MQAGGKIIEIFDAQEISATFKKREFVLEFIDGQYPQFIKFEAVQDKCDLLNNFSAGDMVDVEFNLRGRKWTSPQGEDKYFNTLQAWRITPAGESEQQDSGEISEAPPVDFDKNLEEEIPF